MDVILDCHEVDDWNADWTDAVHVDSVLSTVYCHLRVEMGLVLLVCLVVLVCLVPLVSKSELFLVSGPAGLSIIT